MNPAVAPQACVSPALTELIDDLTTLRQELVAATTHAAAWLATVHPAQRSGACNLVHFLALRRHDLRALQERLAELGLSSLGRAESHVLASVERVLTALHALAGRPPPGDAMAGAGAHAGRARLAGQAEALFGPPPGGRAVRIMVTLPCSMADDPDALRGLIGAGMDIARINAAHDEPAGWERLARTLRAVAAQLGRPIRILLDLPGPKLRTGPLPDAPPVLKLKPQRDELGHLLRPSRLRLRADDAAPVAGADGLPSARVNRGWLARLDAGGEIRAIDARGKTRLLHVDSVEPDQVVVHCDRTLYLVDGTQLHNGRHATPVSGLPRRPAALRLRRGDRLELRHPAFAPTSALSIPCTLPEVFAQVRPGDRIAFDDGRIAGVIRHAGAHAIDIEIDGSPGAVEKLGPDRGINLPSTTLAVSVPTAQDRVALGVAAQVADMVALSFAQRAEDVTALRRALRDLGAPDLPVVLKIETRLGFENLPELMMTAMAAPATGIMIARGDLAVELGWQRLAEVQEEILWAAEAAHLPVVWATQVLESLARTGQPSRAEITDAAMSVRAEAVMLNKGPHVTEAVRLLDDILRRMQQHQHKKRPLLRALRAWTRPPGAEVPAAMV